jgi:hypothetical protein
MPGLNDAIASGSLQVLYLFNQLDKRHRLLDGELMLWAFNNPGGNKMAVIDNPMSWKCISLNRRAIPPWHKPFLRRGRKLQDEKEVDDDRKTLSDIKTTLELPGWKSSLVK